MKNPFVYGKEVGGKNFCNRRKEIAELTRDVINSQNVIAFSQRRFGKTSLINEVFKVCNKKNILTIYVDLYPVLTEEDFIRLYANALAKVLFGAVGKKLKGIREFFKRIKPQFTIDQNGQLSYKFEIEKRDIIPSLEDVLESLNKYVDSRNKKAVVCFDEFQQINQFETDRIEKILRSYIQKHKNISYIFMGSKKHLISDMFNNPNRPFYRSAKSFPISRIEANELIKFINSKFDDTGRSISKEFGEEIIGICESHPYYVQYLCHIIWEQTMDRESINKDDITASLDLLLKRESATFESTWNLLSLKQRRFLAALSKDEAAKNIFSSEFLNKNSLGSGSSVQRVIKSLIDKDLIDKEHSRYTIIDIFFKRWIRNNF